MNCPQCQQSAVWVEYGPRVGRGYYCRGCKQDVASALNEYGLSGTKLMKATTPTVSSSKSMAPLWCPKAGCSTCFGMVSYAAIKPQIGDVVRCSYPTTNLHKDVMYTIQEVTPNGVRVLVAGISTPQEFTCCRFEKQI